jgi:hypothetical protein
VDDFPLAFTTLAEFDLQVLILGKKPVLQKPCGEGLIGVLS